VITRIEPSLQAVFVDFGAERHGFLQKQEIHSDYFQGPPANGNTIQNLVKRGQELMVQVTKDPIMKKGAMLTTFISLPGRYAVLMPGSDSRGISRKIEDETERESAQGDRRETESSRRIWHHYPHRRPGLHQNHAGQGCPVSAAPVEKHHRPGRQSPGAVCPLQGS
jgi:Ribonuclease G/E